MMFGRDDKVFYYGYGDSKGDHLHTNTECLTYYEMIEELNKRYNILVDKYNLIVRIVILISLCSFINLILLFI